MSTRSFARNFFPPLDNPELTIQRRSHVDPTLLNDFEMDTDKNGDPPVPDLQTMEELCQSTLNGRGGPIAPIAIQATNFGLKNDMIQQVQNSCQFHRLSGDDANKHLYKFLHVTQSIKLNGVIDDALRLNSINTFEQMAKIFLGKYFPPSMVTKLRNEITNFRQRPDESLFEAWKRYKLSIDRCSNHNMLPVTQIDTFYNGLTLRHRVTINAAAGGTFMKRRPEECYDLIENMIAHHNDWDTFVQRTYNPKKSRDDPTLLNDLEMAIDGNGDTPVPDLRTMEELNLFPPLDNPELTIRKKSRDDPTLLNDLEMAIDGNGDPPVPDLRTMEELCQPTLNGRGVSKDVFVKVETFYFPADFIVVDFDTDPRVLLILGRSFLKTGRALIDVYEEELTLRVGKESVTFNLDQTSRHSANYDAMSVNQIDLIDVACEENSQEVLGLSMSGNPTPSTKPIASNSSPTLTSFGDSDFLLEETDAFLAIDDEPISSEIMVSYYDSEETFFSLKSFLMMIHHHRLSLHKNSKLLNLPMKNLPPVVELKDLPPHLEYAFLEGDDKLPIIIAKDLKMRRKPLSERF
nr:reverse transcriptase domain-containing protein [Tanacetum cinerariifolium]